MSWLWNWYGTSPVISQVETDRLPGGGARS